MSTAGEKRVKYNMGIAKMEAEGSCVSTFVICWAAYSAWHWTLAAKYIINFLSLPNIR